MKISEVFIFIMAALTFYPVSTSTFDHNYNPKAVIGSECEISAECNKNDMCHEKKCINVCDYWTCYEHSSCHPHSVPHAAHCPCDSGYDLVNPDGWYICGKV